MGEVYQGKTNGPRPIINKHMENTPKNVPEQTESSPNDAAGLLFSGKVKIFDVESGEILVEQRSE